MNSKFLHTERTSREILLFVVVVAGLLVSLAGVTIESVPAAILGILFVTMGLGGFLVRQWLGT